MVLAQAFTRLWSDGGWYWNSVRLEQPRDGQAALTTWFRASPCHLFECDSLSFLTAWRPQMVSHLTWQLRVSRPSVLASQVEAVSGFMGQCWKSLVVFLLHSFAYEQVRGPGDSRREDIDFISQWEECQGHSITCRLGDVVATILGRYNLPHRAVTNFWGGQRQTEADGSLVTFDLSIFDIDTPRLPFIYTKFSLFRPQLTHKHL